MVMAHAFAFTPLLACARTHEREREREGERERERERDRETETVKQLHLFIGSRIGFRLRSGKARRIEIRRGGRVSVTVRTSLACVTLPLCGRLTSAVNTLAHVGSTRRLWHEL